MKKFLFAFIAFFMMVACTQTTEPVITDPTVESIQDTIPTLDTLTIDTLNLK